MVRPYSDPRYIDTTQIGIPFENLMSDPKFVSTIRPTAPWSAIIDGDFIDLVIDVVPDP